MVTSRLEYGEFTKARDHILRFNEQAKEGMVDRWKKAWFRELGVLPYLAKVAIFPPTGRRQQVAVRCYSRFAGLNIAIAKVDMERVFASHASSSREAHYSILESPGKVELHFVEVTTSKEVVCGVVTIFATTG